MTWFCGRGCHRPHCKQAGSQKNRCCIEHIVTLKEEAEIICIIYRRLTNIWQGSHTYVVQILHRLGYASVMIYVLIVIYTQTESLLGTTVVLIIMEVGQGSPTSCLLFSCWLMSSIKIIKSGCELDVFLQRLHIDDSLTFNEMKHAKKCTFVSRLLHCVCYL